MKCSILRQQGLRCLMAVFLTMFMLWGSSPAFAAANEPMPSVLPPQSTYINLKASGAVVNYSANPETLDKMVYDSLAINVMDEKKPEDQQQPGGHRTQL